MSLPGQGTPPLLVAGLSHNLVLCCDPPPHVTEHVPQAFQVPQLPLTEEYEKMQMTKRIEQNDHEIQLLDVLFRH